MSSAPARPPAPPKAAPLGVIALALLADIVLVVIFAAVGRASHDESLLAGLWQTAWPFLVGVGVGWVVQNAWRDPLAVVRTGMGVWGATLVVGMLLRALTGQGIAIPFVIVAAIVLFVLLVGWRWVAALIRKRRARRSTP